MGPGSIAGVWSASYLWTASGLLELIDNMLRVGTRIQAGNCWHVTNNQTGNCSAGQNKAKIPRCAYIQAPIRCQLLGDCDCMKEKSGSSGQAECGAAEVSWAGSQ